MNKELEQLRREYNLLGQLINPSEHEYSFLVEPSDSGSPHVEFVDGEFQYVVTERGFESDRRSTPEINEILYWLVNDLVFWMSVSYELKNRIEGQDCRRIMFAHRQELMERAGHQFADRLAREIEATLAKNPFLDQPWSAKVQRTVFPWLCRSGHAGRQVQNTMPGRYSLNRLSNTRCCSRDTGASRRGRGECRFRSWR